MEFIEKFYHTDIDGNDICEMSLKYCGKRTGAKDHSFGPAARDNYWLIFLKEGKGIYTAGEETFRITSGDLFVAFPNRRIFYRADPGDIWSIGWVSVASERFGEYLAMAGITEDYPVVRVSDQSAMSGLIDELLCEIPKETLCSKFACSSLIFRLLELVAPADERPEKRDYVDEAIFYMTNNYISKLTSKEVAGRLGLEQSYFARIFGKRVGMSPMKWLMEFRLEKAAELLLRTDLRVAEIAASVGYTDQLYFCRRFAAKYGSSPSEYRAAGVAR